MVPNGADLVEEDRLPEFFDQLDDRSGIFPFIEDLGYLPFVQ